MHGKPSLLLGLQTSVAIIAWIILKKLKVDLLCHPAMPILGIAYAQKILSALWTLALSILL